MPNSDGNLIFSCSSGRFRKLLGKHSWAGEESANSGGAQKPVRQSLIVVVTCTDLFLQGSVDPPTNWGETDNPHWGTPLCVWGRHEGRHHICLRPPQGQQGWANRRFVIPPTTFGTRWGTRRALGKWSWGTSSSPSSTPSSPRWPWRSWRRNRSRCSATTPSSSTFSTTRSRGASVPSKISR